MQAMTVIVWADGQVQGSLQVQVQPGQNWTDAIAQAYDDLGF